jgi:hypothetical protein
MCLYTTNPPVFFNDFFGIAQPDAHRSDQGLRLSVQADAGSGLFEMSVCSSAHEIRTFFLEIVYKIAYNFPSVG